MIINFKFTSIEACSIAHALERNEYFTLSLYLTEYDKSRELTAVADLSKLLFAHYNWPQHGGDAFCAEKPLVAGWAKGGQRSGRAVCTSSNLLVT
ncbi:hypothetical protein PoB_001817900 [Plakobranchus ocellatus]|uniref:Uncharacterized protein n=1 Tax=Plakobranchus ocellatus TaxID=259542 RepID=A0AAV3ZCP7_9GAST|nr:hypothetical protein PoB_001817900 [Plakobranchus ocellatus]